MVRCQFYVNEWVTRQGAPRVSSRVRLIQAANFQRKSHIRPRPIKLSVGNPASTFLIFYRGVIWTTFRSQILSYSGVNSNFFPIRKSQLVTPLSQFDLLVRFYPSQYIEQRYFYNKKQVKQVAVCKISKVLSDQCY